MMSYLIKLAGKVKNAANYRGNKDILEGLVAAALMMAYADGTLDPAEEKEALETLQNTQLIQDAGFTTMDIATQWQAFMAKRPGSPMGRIQLQREIQEAIARGAKFPTIGEDIFLTAAGVSLADGNINEHEKKLLMTLATICGVQNKIAEYGLPL